VLLMSTTAVSSSICRPGRRAGAGRRRRAASGVCCYLDYETLVAAAADHARDQLLLTFPRDVWWMRLGLGTINRLQRLRRKTFRVYLHAPAAILDVASSRGLETATRERGRL
jgi:hypothetical protein